MMNANVLSRESVIDALHAVIDPELGYNIVDLGLIYELTVEDNAIKISMTLTTPGCPAQDYILSSVYECSRNLPDARSVEVDLVWEPLWTPERMAPVAKEYFGIRE